METVCICMHIVASKNILLYVRCAVYVDVIKVIGKNMMKKRHQSVCECIRMIFRIHLMRLSFMAIALCEYVWSVVKSCSCRS